MLTTFAGLARELDVYIPENKYISVSRNSLCSKELSVYMSGQPASYTSPDRSFAIPVEQIKPKAKPVELKNSPLLNR